MQHIFNTNKEIPCPSCGSVMHTQMGAMIKVKETLSDYRIRLQCTNKNCGFNNLSETIPIRCAGGHCTMYFADLRLWSLKLFSEKDIEIFKRVFEELINF